MRFDEYLFRRYSCADVSDVPNDCFVNAFGVLTKVRNYEHAAKFAGKTILEPPFPNDGIIIGTWVEYQAILTALSEAEPRGEFNMVELGAGCGPWSSLAGVVARRAGVERINIIAVEAEIKKVCRLRAHFDLNNLEELEPKVIHGAAWHEEKRLFFPTGIPLHDYGAGVLQNPEGKDYRGTNYKSIEVSGLPLEKVCEGLDIVDAIHIDIQGAESEVISHAVDFLQDHVRYMFVGTHSRPIEGRLMQLFFDMDWDVLHQSPCDMVWNRQSATVEAMVTLDGEFFVRNPRL